MSRATTTRRVLAAAAAVTMALAALTVPAQATTVPLEYATWDLGGNAHLWSEDTALEAVAGRRAVVAVQNAGTLRQVDETMPFSICYPTVRGGHNGRKCYWNFAYSGRNYTRAVYYIEVTPGGSDSLAFAVVENSHHNLPAVPVTGWTYLAPADPTSGAGLLQLLVGTNIAYYTTRVTAQHPATAVADRLATVRASGRQWALFGGFAQTPLASRASMPAPEVMTGHAGGSPRSCESGRGWGLGLVATGDDWFSVDPQSCARVVGAMSGGTGVGGRRRATTPG
ncbi:hypothetical protein [Actinokineospora cianjurensis]|uniref:Secreted protein n=1 Tax=Actinokineospora cianjurensis TaxID=585224 RepID=A0A421B272_9PSEU|nr:hypothetical protein [Actinokineospora cianjurensis]RLK58492.1 hypothetical protein CLV68_2959 [Actinokineospora cianjurensis]